MLFMDMENSSKVGAVRGCSRKFCANTCEAVQMGLQVRLIGQKRMQRQWQDDLLGGGVGGPCERAGRLGGEVAEMAEGPLLE